METFKQIIGRICFYICVIVFLFGVVSVEWYIDIHKPVLILFNILCPLAGVGLLEQWRMLEWMKH